jgi:hypothetical protein
MHHVAIASLSPLVECGGYRTVQCTTVILAHASVSKCCLEQHSSQCHCHSQLLHLHYHSPTSQLLPTDRFGVKPGRPSPSKTLPPPLPPPPPSPSQQTLSGPTCLSLHCFMSASILPRLCRNKFQPAQKECSWQDSATSANGVSESC